MLGRRRLSRGRKDWALGSMCLVVAVTSGIIFLQTLNTSPFVRTTSMEDKAKYLQQIHIIIPDELSNRVQYSNRPQETGLSTKSSVVNQTLYNTSLGLPSTTTSSAIKDSTIDRRRDAINQKFVLPKFKFNEEAKCDNTTEVLVYFQSKWSNFMKRRTLRNTWASSLAYFDIKRVVKFVFIIGKPTDINDRVKINNEHLLHGDIIEGDFIDSFHNLTLKSIIAMAFIEENCKQTKYIIKSDDDIFINLFAIFQKVLPNINPDKDVIACHVIEGGKSPIVRDKNSKWYIPPEVFTNRTHLPQFCSGYMVIMTSKVVCDLLEKAKVTPLINVDDVYMFGQLTQELPKLNFINIKENLTLFQANGLDSYRNGKSNLIAISVGFPSAMEELWSLTLIDSYALKQQV